MEECKAPAHPKIAVSSQHQTDKLTSKDQAVELDPFDCLPKFLQGAGREQRETHTLIEINSSHNYNSHQCSYSKVDKGSTSCGFRSGQMTPLDYNELMERGFRRCGEYFYKQDNMKNHWPYYTIRSDATQHKIRKSHQKAWNRWQRYLAGKRDVVEPGDEKEDADKPEVNPAGDTDLENLKDVKHRVEAAYQPITNELASLVKTTAGNADEFTAQLDNLKKKINVIPDKQVPGAFFSNMLVLIIGYFKLEAKDVTKSKEEYLNGILTVPGFDFSVQPNGMLRWKKQIQGQMDIENPQPKAKNSLKPSVEASSKAKLQPKHLEIKLVPAACTTENFDLYKRYCVDIHESKKESESSYQNFLCITHPIAGCCVRLVALCLQTIVFRDLPSKDNVSLNMGCFHMNYYLDGKLVAVGVVDILPKGLSSVYFFYEPYLKPLKFGIIAGLYEIEYIRRLNKAFPMFKYYYLGFYIQQTDKMNYKADFEPCELLCPKTGRFVELTAERRKAIDNKQVWLDYEPLGAEEKGSREFTDLKELKAYFVEKGKFAEEGSITSFTARPDLKSLGEKICTLRADLLMAFGKKVLQRVIISLD